MQRRPIRCLQPTDLVHDITAYVQRGRPVELVEAARDDVFRRLVERLRDRTAMVRPVGSEDLAGSASKKHVELTGDSLANWFRASSKKGMAQPPWVNPFLGSLLGATGRLHDAVQRDLGNGDDVSHWFLSTSLV